MPAPDHRQLLRSAIQQHQAGILADAERLYRKVLASQPSDVDALRYLGLLLTQTGRASEAIEPLKRSIMRNGRIANTHNTLGEALRATGKIKEAENAYRDAVRIDPKYPEPWNNLGIVLHQLGQTGDAIDAYRRAIALRPNYAKAYANLGNAMLAGGDSSEAEKTLRQAIALQPDFAPAHSALGWALFRQGRSDEAFAAMHHSVRLDPNDADSMDAFGRALRELNKLPDAIAAFTAAVRARPESPRLYVNLAESLQHIGRLNDAIACLKQAIEINPNMPEARNNLGSALCARGEHDAAMIELREAIRLGPWYHTAHSNLLLHLHYSPHDPRKVFEEHVEWAKRHAGDLPQVTPRAARAKDRLRIGYISPDLWRHPVAAFLEPILKHRNRNRFELFCYSDTTNIDDVTARLRLYFDRWHDTTHLSDQQLTDLIARDQIDILVDLTGHTARARLLVFARKPAPVQVTYLGYPNTTGLSQMDFRLTDAIADPPGQADELHTEKLIRIDGCFLCYNPPANAPDIRPGPGLTFGSFNRIAKISPRVMELWGRIIGAVPNSRLLIKSTYLNDEATRARVRDLLIARGVPAQQLEVQGPVQGFREHLDAYNGIDIALDCFPYNGTTTTCEALWMGRPVITLAGDSHVSRVGASILTHAGLPELIADNAQHYVDLAAALASDPRRLEDYRAHMRQRLSRSVLLDVAHFVPAVQRAFEEMWSRNATASG